MANTSWMESKERIIEFANEVALFLNEGEKTPVWEYSPQDEFFNTQYVRKIDNHECEISLVPVTYGAGKGRMEIRGNFHLKTFKVGQHAQAREFYDPRRYVNGERSSIPEITVSADRGAQIVAREIKRRFLPEYLPLLQVAIERRDSERNYRESNQAIMRVLAALVLAQERAERAIQDDKQEFSFWKSEGIHGDIKVWDSGKSVELKLDNLSVTQAAEVLSMVAKYLQGS